MHISDPTENAGDWNQKTSLGDKFWQFIRFTVVTGMIFAISFFAINFDAYKEIFLDIVNPEAHAEAREVLKTSTVGQEVSQLLPLLPEKKQVRTQFAWIDAPIAPTDNRLIIPKIGKSIPIQEMSTDQLEGENWNELEKQIQEGLRNGVVHYPGTAKPDQFGNFFITGHSSYYPWDSGKFKDVFALLNQLDVEDYFYVYYNQKKYTYKVYNKFEVQPNNVSVLDQPRGEKTATLMTCTPVGTTLRRLIVQAKQA